MQVLGGLIDGQEPGQGVDSRGVMAHRRDIVARLNPAVLETGQSDLWELAGPLWVVDEPTGDDVTLAEAVIEFVQSRYRTQDHFARNSAQALGMNHALAVHLIRQRWGGSNKPAKEVQLRVSVGNPLAVCIGTFASDRVWLFDGSFVTATDRHGCGLVFPDTTRLSGRVWATTCPACRDKRSERRRSAQRAKLRQFS